MEKIYCTAHIFLKPPQLGHLSRNESRTGIMIFPHQHNTGANDRSMYHMCFHGEALRPLAAPADEMGGLWVLAMGKWGLANKDRRGVGASFHIWYGRLRGVM